MAPFIVSIDGLIGSGKSTLISGLAMAGFNVFPEPVSEWKLLEKYYENPKLYGFAFEMEVLLSQFCQRMQFPDEGLVVVERCPESTCKVFVPMVPLVNEDLAAFLSTYERLAYQVDCFVYLKVDPTVAHQRIQDRSDVDKKISLAYLERLYKQYDNLQPRINVNANRSKEEVLRHVIKILSFIKRVS